MNDKILPCPFCGNEARPVTTINGPDETTEAIECSSCGCSTKSFPFGSRDKDPIEEIIAVWNARAVPSDTQFSTTFKKTMLQLSEALRENDQLRSLVAKSDMKCIYCGLTKEDMSKCASGFPGCGRADDMLLGDLNSMETPTTKEEKDEHSEILS